MDESLHLPADEPLWQAAVYSVRGVAWNGEIAAFLVGFRQRLRNCECDLVGLRKHRWIQHRSQSLEHVRSFSCIEACEHVLIHFGSVGTGFDSGDLNAEGTE